MEDRGGRLTIDLKLITAPADYGAARLARRSSQCPSMRTFVVGHLASQSESRFNAWRASSRSVV
jgi:hypothetical protein